MQRNFHVLFGKAVGLFCACASLYAQELEENESTPPPIRVLLISGGASHDFGHQAEILEAGLRARIAAPLEWRVLSDYSGRSDVEIPGLRQVVGAEDFDIVIHHHCFPRMNDPEYVGEILDPHRGGKPALLIHGSLRSFRTLDQNWAEFCGVRTRRHEREGSVEVNVVEEEDPVTASLPSWVSEREELYLVDKVWPEVKILAQSGETPVIWSHEYGPAKARVFASSLGNDDRGLANPSYLDSLARGLLWSLKRPLSKEFLNIEADQSLSETDTSSSGEPDLNTGYSLLQEGSASAMSTNVADGNLPQHAIDGSGETFWEAERVGPSFWQVALSSSAKVSAIAVHWKEQAPMNYHIEGSQDGVSWRTLAAEGALSNKTDYSVHLAPPVQLDLLRISIPGTAPGIRPGIREISVYGSEEEIPSAFRNRCHSLSRLRTAGPEEPEKSIRLVPEWEAVKSISIPTKGQIVEIQPRADGGLFVMIESGGKAEIFLADDSAEGEFIARLFLSDIRERASFTWDGEWVYLLEGNQLSRLRSTSADGAADERHRFGEIFVPDEAGEKVDVQFRSLGLAMDGWIYAVIEAGTSVSGVDLEGMPVTLPSRGVVRFRRDGRSIQPFLSSHHPVTALRSIGDLSFVITSTSAEGQARHYQIRYGVYPGRPLESFPENPHKHSELYPAGDFIFKGSSGKELELIASLRGLVQLEPSSSGWWAAALNSKGSFLFQLNKIGSGKKFALNLDRLGDAELFPYLASPVVQIRKEAVFEILRRKRDLEKEVEAMLQDRQSPSYVAALALLSQMGGRRSFEILADEGRLSHHAAAFRLLADHDDAVNHPVLNEITKATNPEVTTEILAAVARSGSQIEGFHALVLSFAGVADKSLSATAREWLIQEQASEVCFAAIDGASNDETKEAALSILSQIFRATVAEGLVLRLEKTEDAIFRRKAIRTLCSLYFSEGKTWKGTALIDTFLRASLSDPRVKTEWLLDQMLEEDIPIRDTEKLVTLAAKDIPLQAFTVALLSESEKISGKGLVLLESISESESHEENLRAMALASTLPGKAFGEAFREVARALSWRLLPKTESFLLEKWLETPGLDEQAEFLRSKLAASSVSEAFLAKMSLPATEKATKSSKDFQTEYERGFQVFDRLQCGQCHNIHGEGPAVGPDLVAFLRKNTDESFILSVTNPDHEISPGFESLLIELNTGVQLQGILHSENEKTIQLIDRAANKIDLQKSNVRWHWSEPGSLMPSRFDDRLSEDDYRALITFLRGIGEVPESEQ
ncbi:MAG: ThuA domain-containing protein [Verrucomicrobiales bacterium]|nr:ThuA domain-containing protein [Verrucomicrobiales bacterium]